MNVLNVQNRPYTIGERLGQYLRISSQTNTYPDFFRIGARMRSRLGTALFLVFPVGAIPNRDPKLQ